MWPIRNRSARISPAGKKASVSAAPRPARLTTSSKTWNRPPSSTAARRASASMRTATSTAPWCGVKCSKNTSQTANASERPGGSEYILERELHDARIAAGRDLPEAGQRTYAGGRRAGPVVIQKVEGLCANFHLLPLAYRKRPHQAHIELE